MANVRRLDSAPGLVAPRTSAWRGSLRAGYGSGLQSYAFGMPAVRHVVLVGLMGTGKTTVGRRLAARLGWAFSDSDADIEARRGRTVRQLRNDLGTAAMHRIEADQLLGALAAPAPSVVAAAASVVDDDRCLAALRGADVAVVWLTASAEVAAARFPSAAHRPRYGDDPVEVLARQATERAPRFRSLRPLEVSTDDRTPDEVVAEAIPWLAERGVRPAHGSSARYHPSS